MRVEVETKLTTKGKSGRAEGVEVVMIIKLLPRGSGNRNTARRMAKEIKLHPVFSKHITRVKVGASRVTVHLVPSMELLREVHELESRKDVEGQMPLFGVPA